jgi:hypothetical protein
VESLETRPKRDDPPEDFHADADTEDIRPMDAPHGQRWSVTFSALWTIGLPGTVIAELHKFAESLQDVPLGHCEAVLHPDWAHSFKPCFTAQSQFSIGSTMRPNTMTVAPWVSPRPCVSIRVFG